MNARVFVGLGVCAFGILVLFVRIVIFLDTPPPQFQSSHFINIHPDNLVRAQAKSNDWPVLVARHFLLEAERPPETYELRVGGWRHSSSLVHFQVAGESSNRTEALVLWLANVSAMSLNRSLAAPTNPLGESPAITFDDDYQRSTLVSGRWFGIAVDFLSPLLLVVAGAIIFRLRRHRQLSI
jgi:hypothetical protein